MAITDIFGFQNFDDVLNTTFYDFTPFGKLPLHNSEYTHQNDGSTRTGFRFRQYRNRVWLTSQFGTYNSWHSQQNQTLIRQRYHHARQPQFNIPIERLFNGFLDDPTINRFTMGFRFRVRNATRLPRSPCYLTSTSAINSANPAIYNTLLSQSEIPKVTGADFYLECEFDFETRVIRRWMDSVRMSDSSLHSTVQRNNFKTLSFGWGHKLTSSFNNSVEYLNYFDLNDFYFMADTSHKNDGLPSRRLGPIQVDTLLPKTVELPKTWENETSSEPHELLQTTRTSTNVRNVRGLVSDSAGDKATVAFEQPEVQDGEVIYAELELYAYREYGENVAINTQVALDGEKLEEQQHQLLPDQLRTMDDAIQPAKLHRAPNGEGWTEENLGKMTLDIWSSKPE